MKFAEHLSAHITPEWRKQYIRYEDMKTMIYGFVERLPPPPDPNDMSPEKVEERAEYRKNMAMFEEDFFAFCSRELTKINIFYAEKLAEATRKFVTLKSELDENDAIPRMSSSQVRRNSSRASQSVRSGSIARGGDIGHATSSDIHINVSTVSVKRNQKAGNSRKLYDIKLAFSEFYLSLVLIQNYQNLNHTGFRKILKKHDKLVNSDTGLKWRKSRVDLANFYTNNEIAKLIEKSESVFTNELEGGDRQKAMKRLRVPPLNDQQSPLTTFRVGLFLGAFVVLIIVVILTGWQQETRDDWRIMFRLYRSSLLIILFLFLIGINVYGWRTSGVNHVLIFELDPRDHLTDQHVIEIASFFSVFWCLSVLAFLYSHKLSIPPYANPLVLVIVMIVFLVNPTRTMRHSARFWLLRVVGRMVSAPFFKVNFADFWLADQLNSLVPVLIDIEYFVCFYASSSDWYENNETCVAKTTGDLVIRTIVACLPAWFRFAQCLRRYCDDNRGPFPHLVNAGKYSTTFFVVIFSTLTKATGEKYGSSIENPYFFCWIVSMVVCSSYTYTWDIKMDWGLLDSRAPPEYKGLREEIVYSSPNYYYFAIVQDFILRFGWTLSVSLSEIGLVHSDIVLSILAPLEVFRRFTWNFFRLENEHLNNCGEFRAVRDISIMPIDAGDQAKIIKMMDDPDGVTNRRVSNTPRHKRTGRRTRFSAVRSAMNTHKTKRTNEVRLLMPDNMEPDNSLSS